MNQSKNNWKLGLGLLLGAAAGYWLNTPQGRRLRRESQNTITEYGKQATGYLQATGSRINENVQGYVNQGQEILAQGQANVKQAIANGADTTADAAEAGIDSVSNWLKNGINTARRTVKSLANGQA